MIRHQHQESGAHPACPGETAEQLVVQRREVESARLQRPQQARRFPWRCAGDTAQQFDNYQIWWRIEERAASVAFAVWRRVAAHARRFITRTRTGPGPREHERGQAVWLVRLSAGRAMPANPGSVRILEDL
jgi:hypothetical protein